MLEAHGVEKIYTPDDGLRLGLDGMIADVLAARARLARGPRSRRAPLAADDQQRIAQAISVLEDERGRRAARAAARRWRSRR